MQIRDALALMTLLLALPAQAQQNITETPLLYEVSDGWKVEVRTNLVYSRPDGLDLAMDVYSPAGTTTPLPAIVFVSGSGDTKDWQIYRDYGMVTAAHGMIAIQFNRRYANASELETAREDTVSLLDYVRANASDLGVDGSRLGMWVFSGGGYFADLAMQIDQPWMRFIVSYYGIDRVDTLERIEAMGSDLPPIFMVRAGLDNPNLNNAITLFVLSAIAHNVPIEFINYPKGRHSFDILDDHPETRRIIEATYAFAKHHFGMD